MFVKYCNTFQGLKLHHIIFIPLFLYGSFVEDEFIFKGKYQATQKYIFSHMSIFTQWEGCGCSLHYFAFMTSRCVIFHKTTNNGEVCITTHEKKHYRVTLIKR